MKLTDEAKEKIRGHLKETNESLDALIEVRRKLRGGYENVSVVGDAVFSAPHEAKMEFLKLVGAEIKLDDLYTRFYFLDGIVDGSIWGPNAGAMERLTAQWLKSLEELERDKKKLEELF